MNTDTPVQASALAAAVILRSKVSSSQSRRWAKAMCSASGACRVKVLGHTRRTSRTDVRTGMFLLPIYKIQALSCRHPLSYFDL